MDTTDGTAELASPEPARSWWALLFGQWDPPPWCRWLYRKRGPVVVTLAALALIGYGAWWWATRPPPVIPNALQLSLTAPGLTDYTQTPPTVVPLRVHFSGSAAALERVGKEAPGLSLNPSLAGSWIWEDDRTLLFAPSKDWPVGQHYEIALDAKLAVAETVILAPFELSFDTAAFSARWEQSEFYQDPQDAKLKKAVWGLAFTHPVDAATLESALRTQMLDGAGRALPSPGTSVQYDQHKLKAWVHSAPLELPPNGGKISLQVGKGVVSALGGPGTEGELNSAVTLPALYSVSVSQLRPTLVDNAQFEPEQVLVMAFNMAMRNSEVVAATRAWLLPEKNANLPDDQQSIPYGWGQSEIDEALLAQSQPLPLAADPAEREYQEVHSFKYHAAPGRRIYVRVKDGLKSFGGFILGKPHAQLISVPQFPRLLKFVGEGSLLSLRGERRVTAVTRNLPALRLEVGRVLPEQLHHLVQFNEGDYQQPSVWAIGEDSLVERMEKRVTLPNADPAKTHYEGIDIGEFFRADRHGVFLLSLRTLSDSDAQLSAEETIAQDAGEVMDSRLVVLTDLGIVVKRTLDGSREVFVQSLSQGTAVVGARIKAVARNGETLVAVDTDTGGHASLPSLDGFTREKQPAMIAVSLGEDLSFLPWSSYGRDLDLSRFDIGGDANDLDGGTLKAYLFSDRGLYRPGDTVNLGYIVRASDWSRPLSGIPLEIEFSDPRGSVVKRERVALDATGFSAFSHTPPDSAPSGTWQATLYLIGERDSRTMIGSTTVQIREFMPDTLRVRATLSAAVSEGWVKPDGLSATVAVENLFGTPAQERKVEATLVLRPAFPNFARWPQWQFYDPLRTAEGFNEPLSDGQTDENGIAEFDLGLQQFDRATYQLSFLARAFEPGSGRNVAAQTGTLVSSNDFLVGLKADDALNQVKRGSKRALEVVTIGPDAKAAAVENLRVLLIERRYVSILTKQDSGLYKYVSQERRNTLSDSPLPALGAVQKLPLKTDQPGDYFVEIRDAADTKLNEIHYVVAGAANVARSLERNAELALSLSKTDYQVGEEIEIGIRAPYVGSGLITIERDQVYAHTWFRAETTSSVQKIRVPEGLEGNAYVNVQFIRDPSSDEVYMSPLSYAVAPFSVDRGRRTQGLSLSLPAVSKPGADIALKVSTQGPTRVIAFAIDEGILQVARYRLANPLDHFFRKKMLDVQTAQILDLILPEFSRLMAASAPGGDGEGDLAKHLNPFKRKSERPAVWWSGPTDIDGEHTFTFSMPDHFNGELRVMAVAVTPERVGIAQTRALVRGDFVLTPTVPTHVAPGDEFELPVGIANTVEGAGPEAMPVSLKLDLPKSLTLVGELPPALSLKPGQEGTVRVRLRAGEALGAQPIGLLAESGTRSAKRRIELSLRPAIVARTDLRLGRADRRTELKDLRRMYPERSQRLLSASTSPFVAADGLAAYLADYPHLCTEQLLSQAMPALVYRKRPEFGTIFGGDGGDVARLSGVLRARQNGQGGIGLWLATPDVDPFITAYAMFYLVEARERGEAVPSDLIDAGNRYLTQMAGNAALTQLHELRARALATYLLIRQGQTATHLLSAVHEQLKRDYPQAWKTDTIGMLLASSYALLQQAKPAKELAQAGLARVGAAQPPKYEGYAYYYDAGIDTAWVVYLAHKHFPKDAERISVRAIENLLQPLRDDHYNTLSSALIVLALDAYTSAKADAGLPRLMALGADGKERPIGEAFGALQRGTFLANDQSLWVTPPEATPSWYVLSQSGFDKQMPKAVQNQGIEIVREYLNADGTTLTEAALGQEITVRLRLRALGGYQVSNIAVVDLLPGGFEPVVQMPPPAPDAADDEGDDEGGDEGDGGDSAPPIPTLALPGSTLYTEHIEQREDRVVLYASAGAQVAEFLYKVRPSNPGTFVVPPVYAESMYERRIYAQGGPAGTLQVK
jgi:alpha-2-macroglobulin